MGSAASIAPHLVPDLIQELGGDLGQALFPDRLHALSGDPGQKDARHPVRVERLRPNGSVAARRSSLGQRGQLCFQRAVLTQHPAAGCRSIVIAQVASQGTSGWERACV